MDKIKKEVDILIGMIQQVVTLKASNYEIYKDKVTKYREILYKQAMKVKRMLKENK